MRSLRRILIAQPYGIGDGLLMTPLLRALRTIPTVEAVDLLLGSRTESVFQNNPHVDQIFSIDKGKWHSSGKNVIFKELSSLWKNLRGRYDLLIDFSLQREYGFYGMLLGIPRRVGFNFKGRGIFLTESLPLPKGFEGAHVVDFYCELGKLIGLEIEDRFLEFYLSEEDRKSVSQIPTPYLAVAPGGGESWGNDAVFKRWPVTHFVELLSRMKERMDFEAVVVLGSGGEREFGEELQRNLSQPVFNFCGELSLGTSAALLEKSALFVANDGGLVHLARALHVPAIAFYGPVDPQVYGPYPPSPEAASIAREGLPCRPCYRRFRYNSACADRECLTALTPGEVLERLNTQKFWKFLNASKVSH